VLRVLPQLYRPYDAPRCVPSLARGRAAQPRQAIQGQDAVDPWAMGVCGCVGGAGGGGGGVFIQNRTRAKREEEEEDGAKREEEEEDGEEEDWRHC